MYKFNQYVLNEDRETFGWKKGTDAPIIPYELYKNEDTSNIMYADALDKVKFFNGDKKTIFLKKIVWIAKQFEIPVNWIMGIFYIETGGKFNPDAGRDKPNQNNAFGLFQILPPTFRGTFGGDDNRAITTDPVRQMDYYYFYLMRFIVNRVLTDPISMYLMVMGSRYMLEPMDYKFRSGVYHGNSGLFGFFKSGQYKGTKIDLYLTIITTNPIYKQLWIQGHFNGNKVLMEWIDKLGVRSRLPKVTGQVSSKQNDNVEPSKKSESPIKLDIPNWLEGLIETLKKVVVGNDTKC